MENRVTAALLALTVAGCAARPPVDSAAARLVLAEAVDAPRSAPPSSATKSTPAEHEGRSSSGTTREAGWIAVGVGAGAAVIALGTSAAMLHASSVRGSGCDPQKLCSADGINANDQLHSLAGWNAGAWTIAAIGLGAGAYLIITNPPGSTTRTAVGVAPNGSGAGFDFRGSF